MNKKIRWIAGALIILSIMLIIGNMTIRNKKLDSKIGEESWIAYFAPSDTDISYGDTNAHMIKIGKSGNIEVSNETAYAFPGIVNYKGDIIYQTTNGIDSLKPINKKTNILKDKNTVGYNMADVLDNKELFYFLLNESFKDDYYSSNIIIGNEENQTLHQIKGFVNGYGDDEDNIYLLTSDMKNKYLKQIHKISVYNQEKISINKNDIILDTIIDANNNMIIVDGYIYCFAVKAHYGVSMLKISSETLQLDSIKDLIKFDSEDNDDRYYPISANSIFYNKGKIYYPTLSGEVYSFDIKTNNFKKEFAISDYDFDSDANIISYYSSNDSELSFLYYENKENKYCLSTYSLDGNLKDKIYLDKLKIKGKEYPHSFIKLNK
ncbi:hypothetical protein BH721_06010 [Clostridium baratii]|uniref:hypothetical protein n=1 Tax=Clostridium baratii TaxID=1561 RepID=UPI0009A301A4|nr:hypothetical protein [Clostridium baratii]OPF52811.1 hypothetical protein A1M12_12220 [Clostridium baratii]OPF56260.1 hypothetical protein BH721_06010 [Clostridium baratii]OPF58145.1 hypothetical protein BH724_04565 [Clostridium baratii]OPF59358.1 hypothetical protein BH725_01910 [Clostridium baratii]